LKNLPFYRVYELCVLLTIMVSVLLPKLVALSFGIWFITIVFGVFQKKIRFVQPNLLSILFWLLFMSYLIGTIWTNHPEIAFKYIEYKLSLLIIPLLFLFQPKEGIIQKRLIVGFVVSVGVLGLYSFIQSLFHSPLTLDSVTSVYFSTIHHPTYLSGFAFLAMVMSVQQIHMQTKLKERLFWAIMVVVLVAIQFLCLSLAGLLLLMLFIIGYAVYLIKCKFGKIGLWVSIALVPIVMYLSIQFIPGFKTQFKGSKLYFLEYMEDPIKFVKTKKTYLGGDETRLILWTATIREIKKHPFGVGTGNLDDHLTSQLQYLTHYEMAEKKYNPHNQFFQTALEVGIPAAVLILFIVGWCIFKGLVRREYLLVLLSVNLFINCLFESMLQRQSGIVFYTLWMVILSVYFSNKQELVKHQVENDSVVE